MKPRLSDLGRCEKESSTSLELKESGDSDGSDAVNFQESSTTDNVNTSDPTLSERELMLFSAHVLGYSLVSKKWGQYP